MLNSKRVEKHCSFTSRPSFLYSFGWFETLVAIRCLHKLFSLNVFFGCLGIARICAKYMKHTVDFIKHNEGKGRNLAPDTHQVVLTSAVLSAARVQAEHLEAPMLRVSSRLPVRPAASLLLPSQTICKRVSWRSWHATWVLHIYLDYKGLFICFICPTFCVL